MRHNSLKEKLRNGETVYGCFIRYPNASLVEVLGYCGWDFIVFDMVPNADVARQWWARGARYIAVGFENVFNPACRNYLKSARE